MIKWLERYFRLSDFGKGAWIRQGSEALFSRNMRKNTGSLVGGLIGFDCSLQGGRRNTDPKLMWGMSDNPKDIFGPAAVIDENG